MRGLLLKEWYMMKAYCRYYLVCGMIFTILSVMSKGNMFFVFYPCILCGMIPINLLSYDERSRWLQYSAVLPYTRSQIVSAKYLAGLLSQVLVLVVMGIAQGVKMAAEGEFMTDSFFVMMLLVLIIAAFSSAIPLPFCFKLGVEKGRIAYYVMIGFVCTASVAATHFFQEQMQQEIRPNVLLTVLAVLGVCAYALSWYLSIRFFEKREL